MKRQAFSLLEAMIAIIILGVLAAILIPNLILRQIENNNRSRVKKAMAVYEQALRNIVIENGLKNNKAIIDFGASGTCDNTRPYFKNSENGENNCIFKTGDGIWWNIADIENPIISVDDKITIQNLETIKANAKDIDSDTTSFAFVGRIDNTTKTLRINDNAFEQEQNNNGNRKKYMTKLWYYLTKSNAFMKNAEFQKCMNSENSVCYSATGVSYTKKTAGNDFSDTTSLCVKDPDTNEEVCGYTSTVEKGTNIYFTRSNIDVLTAEDATSDENCATSTYTYCSTNGDYWNLARRTCEAKGGRLPTSAEIKTIYAGSIAPRAWINLESSSSPDIACNSAYSSGGSQCSYSKSVPPGDWRLNSLVCVND